MRALFAATMTVLALALGACGSGGDDAGDDWTVPFDTARAMRDVEQLSKTIGPRPGGSEAAVAAAKYIEDEFAAVRYGVIRSNFTFETDPNRPAAVELGGVEVTAITAGGSKAGTVSGPAVALPNAVSAGALTGKVAVAVRGGASFQEKHDIAWASGAAGLVIVNSDAGEVTANLGEPAKIPVVTVAGSFDQRLEAAAASGAPLTIAVPAPETATGTNITARPRGAHSCIYIVVANYDSTANSPGANDNASGVAVTLELARQLNDRFPVPEVCFVALDAHFSGGQGAYHYLDVLTKSGRPAMVISVANLGAGDGLAMYGELTLKNRLSEIANGHGVTVGDGGNAPPVAGNGAEFRNSGITTLELERPGGKSGRDDTFDRIDGKKLEEAGRLIGELAVAIGVKTRAKG